MNTVSTSELIEVLEDNSSLPVVPVVSSEVVPNDDCGYWIGRVSYIHVGKYTDYDGNVYTDEEEEELFDDIIEKELWEGNKDKDEETLLAEAKEKASQLYWREAILVYVGTPD